MDAQQRIALSIGMMIFENEANRDEINKLREENSSLRKSLEADQKPGETPKPES